MRMLSQVEINAVAGGLIEPVTEAEAAVAPAIVKLTETLAIDVVEQALLVDSLAAAGAYVGVVGGMAVAAGTAGYAAGNWLNEHTPIQDWISSAVDWAMEPPARTPDIGCPMDTDETKYEGCGYRYGTIIQQTEDSTPTP